MGFDYRRNPGLKWWHCLKLMSSGVNRTFFFSPYITCIHHARPCTGKEVGSRWLCQREPCPNVLWGRLVSQLFLFMILFLRADKGGGEVQNCTYSNCELCWESNTWLKVSASYRLSAVVNWLAYSQTALYQKSCSFPGLTVLLLPPRYISTLDVIKV